MAPNPKPIESEPAMFTEQIEKMKRQYTDKYVVVDATRPELARFRDVVGRVKTVNMSGRALVEFDDYHLNIGWYDIDPDFLKVVDKPPPKPPKVEAKKPAAKAEAKPAAAKAPAKAAPAAGAKAAGKGSVADVLAAARAGKAPATPAGEAEKTPAKAESVAAKPAAPAAGKLDRSKMSVAEMLAAARGGAGAAPAKAPPTKPHVEEAPAKEEAVEEAPAAKAAPASPAAAKEVQRVDKSKMSIDEIVAYCRERDAK
ncbi:MAG: hypothetical protein L0228_14255 [Planctomycetes bacterium]|nr:hypothetical protein [Planctomycetota bacterium]